MQLKIEKIVDGGLGLARSEGHIVFVPGVLPGESVSVELERVHGGKRSYGTAKIDRILSPSPDRVEPVCRYFGVCGGCDAQYASQEAQLNVKQSIILDVFSRQAGMGSDELTRVRALMEDIPMPPWSYRNRMQFHPDTRGRPGLFKRGSSEVVPIETCAVASKEINVWLSGRPTLNLPSKKDFHVDSFDEGGERYPVFGAEDHCYTEADEIDVVLGNKHIRFSNTSFFQSSIEGLHRLILWITETIDAEKRTDPNAKRSVLADLYCGVGVFAAFLEDSFDLTYAVDRESVNCRYARLNTNSKRTKVIEADVDIWSRAIPNRPDWVIIDPPRGGLGGAIRAWLSADGPERMIYVSCNPVTLARDLKFLYGGGYRIVKAAHFDFYPQSWRMEVAVCLVREQKAPDSPTQ